MTSKVALTFIALAWAGCLAPVMAHSAEAPVQRQRAWVASMAAPEAGVQTVAKRHYAAHGQSHTRANPKSHGTAGCFHGVGKFGGGCR